MGDDLRNVQAGEPLAIPAGAYNAFVGAARRDQASRLNIGGRAFQHHRQADMLLVQNDSGADVGMAEVLGIDGILIDPSVNINDFRYAPSLSGITPATASHLGNFVVTAEPIADGAVGLCYIAGACACYVKMNADWHDYCDVSDGEGGYLNSAALGSARIIKVGLAAGPTTAGGYDPPGYSPPGYDPPGYSPPGRLLAVVRLGDSDPGVEVFFAEITGNTAADGPAQNRWKYAWSEVSKSVAAYDGWAVLAGGRSGSTGTDPARNTIEDMNTGANAHVEGCGVDPEHLDTGDYTFEIMPCTTGNIVAMYQVPVGTGTAVEYWFNYENGVDGTCD